MPLRLLLLLCLWGLPLQRAETDSEGQTTGELYQRWERYGRECQETLEAADPPSGIVCNGSFDMYVCWDYTAANTTARASCPWYLPWYRHVAAGSVFRQCGSDGQWGSWRDHTQCENPGKNGTFQDQRLILERLQVVYTVGYSMSLAALLLAQLTLSLFRRLHCTRNYIHMNLFASFMLRAAAILTRDRLLPALGPYTGDQTPSLWNQAPAACRTAQIVTQYCVGANYTWLLVEGVYLHHLLVIVGGSEKGHFRCYLLLGWGAPALFVIPWVIARYLYENTQCWERNEVKAIWWIIRTPILITILVGPVSPPPGCAQGFPILGKRSANLPSHPKTEWLLAQSLLSSQINFLIFIRILGILVSKLRTRQMRCPDYRLRLARSTLTLVPLLGVHEVVFAPVTEEQAEGALRLAKLAFEIFLSSFQGFLVSVLYCFINKEVQSEIRRGWRHRRLRLSLREERPGPHLELSPPALPSRPAPREAPIGSAWPSRSLHVPGDEVLESYC
ncbi:gastric inhibitory polypeptide receptor isoform X2 [Onychomys torridus]|uniref:gastric inhibitory polypeptide receptor isoform X2 n=1 Tax=Onychomys torridus TaxID=38674 RepID=UPI00167FDD72|nr:gastric inhibitory polypeptide receptor isoform X2 [Onychomys torridus]